MSATFNQIDANHDGVISLVDRRFNAHLRKHRFSNDPMWVDVLKPCCHFMCSVHQLRSSAARSLRRCRQAA
jgi:hypothetical protein